MNLPADEPVTNQTKTCRLCGKERPVTDFYVRTETGRRRSECAFCCRAKAKASASTVQQGDARWMTRRDGILRRKYGLSNEEFERMSRSQSGKCRLCGEQPEVRRTGKSGKQWTGLHVDHCHGTARVRGLLCHRCNTMLGWAERVGLDSIAAYLA